MTGKTTGAIRLQVPGAGEAEVADSTSAGQPEPGQDELGHEPDSRRPRVTARRIIWQERLWAHRWELFAVALGFALRFSMWKTFDPAGGYDFPDHWTHLSWYAEHWSFPAKDYTRTAYHAPLYHFLAGMARRLGVAPSGMQLASVLMACMRIVFLAVGLNLTLPRSPRARAIALLLAAVMPCSVHLDGMVTQEPLSNLLAVVTLVMILLVFRAPPQRRVGWAVLTGFAAGLALLTKVSALAVAGVLMAAGPLEMLLAPPSARGRRLGRLFPWFLALLTMCVVAGWWYVRSKILYGKAFVSGWDLGIDGGLGPQAALSALDRRTIGYVTYWSSDIYANPHYPAGTTPSSRFWPVLVASTFVDYYHYNFVHASLSYAALFARISVVGGTVITAISAPAWVLCIVSLVRRKNVALLVMLMLPLLGVLGQLSFAIQFPYDWEGVVKGIYLHFSMAPMYGVFGVAVARLRRPLVGRAVAALALLGVAAVASYTIYCRWV